MTMGNPLKLVEIQLKLSCRKRSKTLSVFKNDLLLLKLILELLHLRIVLLRNFSI
jgi:hypothetical protein